MNHGRRDEQVFKIKKDYQRFIDILHEAIELFSLRVSAYCLMSNHYHLLVQTPEGNLSRCMRHVNGVYTQRFNAAHGLDGPLFRGRYKAIVVGKDSYLLQLVRYIHHNPVRAGLVESAEEYAWSSHQGYLSAAKKWNWLHKQLILSMLEKNSKFGEGEKGYRRFMNEAERESFLKTMSLKKLPSVLGSSDFIDMIKAKFFERKRHVEVPQSKGLAPDVDRIIGAVCNLYGIDRTRLFRARRGVLNEARSMAAYLCRYLRGESLTSIGNIFGIDSYSTVSSIIERFKERKQSDRNLMKKVEQLKIDLMRQGQT